MGIIKTEHFENLDELDTEIGRNRLRADYYTRFLKMKNILPFFWLIMLIIFITYNVILDEKMLSSQNDNNNFCLLYTSPSPRDLSTSRMPSSA